MTDFLLSFLVAFITSLSPGMTHHIYIGIEQLKQWHMNELRGVNIQLPGIVQGVGFRPSFMGWRYV